MSYNKIDKKIIIARSATNLSSMSKESALSVMDVLNRHYKSVKIMQLVGQSDLDLLLAEKPDLVFLGFRYLQPEEAGEKIWVTDFLDENNIKYTGSGKSAGILESDKDLAKLCIENAGLQTAEHFTVGPNDHMPDTIAYPLFVKPHNKGGGAGIDEYSVVNNATELQSKVAWIYDKYSAKSMVEKYLTGREFSVAILRELGADNYVPMPLELIAPDNIHGQNILSSVVKRADAEKVTRITDESLKARLNTLAIDAFHALGAVDYGRIDIRLDENGVANFLEANLLPSLITGYGSFPKACIINADLSYEPMILQIATLALEP
jgi:D-alanine-D-alanine ligase